MKIYTYILTFCLCVSMYGQERNFGVHSGGNLIVSDGKMINAVYDFWPSRMADAYLAINNHYPEEFAEEVETFIKTLFDTSSYYQSTFGDSTTAGWFHVLKTDGNLITRSESAKSGANLRWEVEGSVYNTTDLPNHTLVGDDAFVVVSSTDGWSGLTGFSVRDNNFIGAFPRLVANNLIYLYIDDNTFEILPELNFPNVAVVSSSTNSTDGTLKLSTTNPLDLSFYSNSIDSIALPENWIHTKLSTAYFNTNTYSKWTVNNILDKAAIYYAENTPIKNLALWMHNVVGAAPTCGDYNPDVLRLEEEWADAGFTLDLKYTGAGTGALQVETIMSMPDTIYILVGEEFEIYDENITGMNIKDKNINIEYTCDIGDDSYFGYVFDEVVGDVGFYDFKAVAKVCNTKYDSVECVVRLLEGGNGSGSKTFNFIGNSLTQTGSIYFLPAFRNGLTGITAETVGNRGTSPNKHEGWPGNWWVHFTIDYIYNPFWIGGALDYTAYRTTTLGMGSPIDFTTISLGINDMLWNGTSYVNNIINYIDLLVNEILSDGTGYVIINLQPKGENTGDGWFESYGDTKDQNEFLHRMTYLQDTICSRYSGRRYANNVLVSPQGLFIDRNDGYPKDADGYHTNGVHPDQSGYIQMSNAHRALIEGLLKEESE